MRIQQLHRTQLINAPLSEVWDFFSHAGNLGLLTPAYMQMRVTSGELPTGIYKGQLISYKLRPVAGIPISWTTEITGVVPKKLFIDEQRRGPYKLWRHEHHFEEQPGKVLMTDIVHYRLPYWFIGSIAHALFVKRQLQGIFDYRQRQVAAIFK